MQILNNNCTMIRKIIIQCVTQINKPLYISLYKPLWYKGLFTMMVDNMPKVCQRVDFVFKNEYKNNSNEKKMLQACIRFDLKLFFI